VTVSRVFARGLCRACYDRARHNGTLHQHPVQRPQRPRADFVADYRLLRSEGYTHAQMAERLGMKRRSFYAAYARAVAAGELTPDRRTA
jgi:CRP-like cAMP-binding protein